MPRGILRGQVKVCPKCAEPYANDVAACPIDGAELKKTVDPYLGRTIAARYRLIRRLGAGGMASVYLARHVMIDRLSAIKILRQDFSLNPTHRERFLREARAVNRINHENIVEITDCGEMDGIAYLVMEYVEGKTLHQELEEGALPWIRAAKIALQIASALGRAHQMGVVHRDLKPDNILLVRAAGSMGGGGARAGAGRGAGLLPEVSASAEFVKLTDFGIAKIVDAPALTFSEQLFGTPGYIAPECIEALPVDGRTDLYSLGVVLYECVTACLPWDARGADLLTAPLLSAPIPPGARTAGLPPDLESLILTMLSRSMDDRPADAFAVQDALVELLRQKGGLEQPGRTSIPAARDTSPTLIESPPAPEEEAGTPSRRTANVHKLQTSEIASRWQGALAELEASIEKARRPSMMQGVGSGPRQRVERAELLASEAKEQLAGVERAARLAAEHQAKVDRCEARGREFRATLGHAIDDLVRHRTRERIHAAALGARHDALVAGTPHKPPGLRLPTGQPPAPRAARGGPSQVPRGSAAPGPRARDEAGADALVWEAAALGAEAERARLQEKDLSHQIATLQARLEEANAQLEAEIGEASGALEGALAALRQLTGEFVKTLDDAAAEVSGSSRAG
jgi:serine/threonine protein kinase